MNIRFVIPALWLCLAGFSHARAGAILYVDDDAAAGGDGTSWTLALTHLQDAFLIAAQGSNGISEIRVAQGLYIPDRSSAAPRGTGDRAASFYLPQGVAVLGGYLGLSAGKGESPDDRDIAAYQAVLTGDLAGNDGPPGSFENAAENSYQVVIALNVDDTSIIDGFTITAGHADGPGFGAVPASKEQGAGLNIYFATPTILSCTFKHNWSANHGAINDHGHAMVMGCSFIGNYAQGFGAGLYVHHHSETMAIDCTFIGNTTPGEGGGAYSRSMHHPVFMNCTFMGNSATLGGGMWVAEDSNIDVIDCAFTQNSASLGGGMYHFYSEPMVMNCTFSGNTVTGAGAGIYSDFGTGTVQDCEFTENIAPNGGGGMWNATGAVTVENCSFTGNIGSNGGGIYNGDFGVHQVSNCTFFYNQANEGGGLYNIHTDSTVSDCTFVGNSVAEGAFSVGGGASNYFCSPVFRRCSFANNSAELGGGGMYNEGESPTIIDCTFHANSTFGKLEGWGGAILSGYFTTPTFVNCEFVGNSANQGGGLFHLALSDPTFVNCTVAGNVAAQGAASYGYNEGASTLANCIVWGNGPAPIEGVPPTVTYSCVEGGFAGPGNINSNPLFVATPNPGQDEVWSTGDDDFGNLQLAPASPCTDASDNTMIPAGIVADLQGQPRYVDDPAVADTGIPNGLSPIADMGAIERQPIVCAADLAPAGGNGVVNVDDLLSVISNWGPCGGCAADLNGNGVVDVDDLLAVIAAWGPCP